MRLIAGGKTLAEKFNVVMDPRVKTPMADLEAQFNVSKAIYDDALKATSALHEITVLRDQMRAKPTPAPAGGDSLESKLTKIAGGRGEGGARGGGGRGGPVGPPNLTTLRLQLARMEVALQSADAAPTTAQVEAYDRIKQPLADLIQQWDQLKATDLKTLNEVRRKRGLPLYILDTYFLDHNVEDQIEVGDDN